MTNFLFVLFSTILMMSFQASADEESGIGYATVKEALADLSKNPHATFRTQASWTIVEVSSPDENSIWSFTPEGHAAYPAVVKRTIYEKDGAINLKMQVLCRGKKSDCDFLVEQFKELNSKVKNQAQGGGA